MERALARFTIAFVVLAGITMLANLLAFADLITVTLQGRRQHCEQSAAAGVTTVDQVILCVVQAVGLCASVALVVTMHYFLNHVLYRLIDGNDNGDDDDDDDPNAIELHDE
jgi:hypothetical protein